MLFFNKKFFHAIRAGTKTTTLRYWRSRRAKSNSIHWVRGLGQLHVESVRVVELDELADEDAHRDGFENIKDLQRTLDEYYPPEKRKDRNLYLVKFKYLPK